MGMARASPSAWSDVPRPIRTTGECKYDILHAHPLTSTAQNVAEIDEISWGQEIQKVILPAAERAIYLELEHYLRAIDMTVKRGRKSESDREKRLAQALGDSRCVSLCGVSRCNLTKRS